MILEVCIDTFHSAKIAKAGGANRLEVCGPLSVGGTTPSAAMIEQCVAMPDIDVMVMIRPNAGGFHYEMQDIETMLKDIAFAKSLKANGVVFGALTEARKVDVETMKRLIDAARPMEITFHRAFDVAADPFESIDRLVELNVDRLLTSGQAKTAIEGAALISQLVQRAGESISIMAGSGVNADNVNELVRQTAVHEVHASGSEPNSAEDYPIDFGGRPTTTSFEKVRALRVKLTSIAVE